MLLLVMACVSPKTGAPSEQTAVHSTMEVPVMTNAPASIETAEAKPDESIAPETTEQPAAEPTAAPAFVAEGYPVFDFETKTVTLNSGYAMPILGIGTYALSDNQAENSTYWALKAGFRLIDTARIYGNETGVGRGLRRAIDEGIVTREEVFITTKMWTSDFSNGDAAVDASLQRLGVDYIDLMILHHSQPSNDVDAYQAMERAVEAGKLRSIGLSNYYEPDDFDRVVNATTIKPALLQNETHPYHQSGEMKEHIAQYGTVLESWFPLGGRGNTQTLFNDETISSIAVAHGVSSAQVIIRWHLQAGNICIPGSSNEQHMPTNATTVKKPKTKAGTRIVPIPDAILPALQKARREAISMYVCPAVNTGDIMSAQAYSEAWKSYMHYLNICAGGRDKVRTKNENGKVCFIPAVQAMEPFTAHQLRHSYATMLYDADVDVKTAQKLLGHADFSVTMKIYTHLSAEKESAGIEKLNQHVTKCLGDSIRNKVREG